MTQPPPHCAIEAVTAVAVGAGPTNLAIAAAALDAGWDGSELALLERRAQVGWHSEMMVEGARIQLNVLKDLVTPRDPTSRFSFLNYLKHEGRLFEFLNLRSLYPGRHEFEDYLRWVAGELGDLVRVGREVVEVRPEIKDQRIRSVVVVSRDVASGRTEALRARSLIVATGLQATWPTGIAIPTGAPIIHPASYLSSMERLFSDREAPRRFVVVGGGQSSGEIFLDLLRRYPRSEIILAVRGFAPRPTDDSHFVNEIFHPENVELVFGLPNAQRRELLAELSSVNYGVIDAPLIGDIYRELYERRVRKMPAARVMRFAELTTVGFDHGKLDLRFRHRLSGEDLSIQADGAVLATGFTLPARHPLLASLDPFLLRDGEHYRVGHDYRVAAAPTEVRLDVPIFIPGMCPESHGPSEPVLSMTAHRAGLVVDSLGNALARTRSAGQHTPLTHGLGATA